VPTAAGAVPRHAPLPHGRGDPDEYLVPVTEAPLPEELHRRIPGTIRALQLLSKNDRTLKNEAIMKLICWNIWRLIVPWYELGVEPVFERDDAEAGDPREILKFPPHQ